MRKSTPMKATILAIVTGTLLSASVAYAADNNREGYRGDCQHGQHMSKHMGKQGKRGMMKMFAKLDLSAEQKAEIKTLVQAHHQKMQDQRPNEEARKAHREEMLAAITAESFDELQIQQLLEAKKAKRQQAGVEKLKLQNTIFKTLTPEQQQEFKKNFLSQTAGKCGHGKRR